MWTDNTHLRMSNPLIYNGKLYFSITYMSAILEINLDSGIARILYITEKTKIKFSLAERVNQSGKEEVTTDDKEQIDP